MSKFATVARWVVAIPAAIVAFVVGVLLVGIVYKHVGGNPFSAQTWAIAVATILAGTVGIPIAPGRHRTAACYIFSGMPVLVSVILLQASLVEHTFDVRNVFDVAGSVTGGLIVWRGTRGLRLA